MMRLLIFCRLLLLPSTPMLSPALCRRPAVQALWTPQTLYSPPSKISRAHWRNKDKIFESFRIASDGWNKRRSGLQRRHRRLY